MAGKRYSAGSIFLQVVPVFENIQKDIEAQADDINRTLGDRMEKAGKKAGERAGKAASKGMSEELKKGSGEFEREFHKTVDGINSALNGIDTKRLPNALRKELAGVKKEISDLKKLDLVDEKQLARAEAGVYSLEGAVQKLRDSAKNVFRPDLDKALKGFGSLRGSVEKTKDAVEEFTATSERKIGIFEQKLKKSTESASKHLDGTLSKSLKGIGDQIDSLGQKKIGIDISGAMAVREADKIAARLKTIETMDPEVEVRLAAGAARADLVKWTTAVRAADAQEINVKADVNTGAAEAKLRSLRNAVDSSGNSFRSFNAIMLLAASIGPALIPVIAGIGGAMLALGPAAAVAAGGIGAVMVGFSGIGDALTALGNRDKQAAMTAQTAGRAQESSAKAVAAARRSAAKQIESAMDRQREAQERYRDSVNDVREAEQALRDARLAAKDTGKDLDRAARTNKLAIEQALLDSFGATTTFNAVSSDGSSTNAEREQARIDREEALLRLEELRIEQAEIAAEKAKWDKEGVNGTDGVQTAQERLNDAIEAQRKAYRDLGKAAREVDEARAEGARAVRDAMASQADAMEGITSQQNAVNEAFNNLGPAGQRFALFLYGLRGAFRDFRDDVQQVLLPAVQQAIESFMGSRSAGIARNALILLADAFGKFAISLSNSFQGAAWTGFFQMLADLGPTIMAAYGTAFIKFLEALASIMVASAPFAVQFAEGLAELMTRFADWAASKDGQDGIQRFLAYVKEVGPDVLKFIGALASALVAVGKALAPWASTVLDGLTGFLEFIAEMDPKILAPLATGIIILMTSLQTTFGVMAGLQSALTLLLSPIGLWVLAIAGIGLALVYLYKTNEDFRRFIDKTWSKISKIIKDNWEKYLKPSLERLGKAFENLWKEVLQPFFAWLGPVIAKYIEFWIPILMKWWSVLATAIAWAIDYLVIPAIKAWASVWKAVWDKILYPVIKALSAAFTWLWEKVLKPNFQRIQRAWEVLGPAIRLVWTKYIKPAFDNISTAVGKVKTAFQRAIEGIKRIWDKFGGIIEAPVKFVVNTVLRDGLIAGINKVLGFVKLGKIKFSGIPNSGGAKDVAGLAMATGGVLPGYTPGRDPHKFVSPTGGRLELSGGEAIMRPEWTRAVGPGFVDQMNALARGGGVNAIRRALGGQKFAKGGVFWPLPGGTPSTYRNHDGVDLNSPNDLGKPFFSATSGRVTTTGYSRGYGNAVFVASPYGELVYGHAQDGSIAVRPGTPVSPGTFLARVGSTGNSTGPHLHFGFPGGTYLQAMGLLQGAYHGGGGKIKGAAQALKFPSWILDVARNPLGYVKGLVEKPVQAFKDKFSDSGLRDALLGVPGQFFGSVKDKIYDILPGPVKTAAKGASKVLNPGSAVKGALGAVGIGGEGGYANGGILPYNGTMKYDNGGYLPPGLTNVVNLTGRPEPVFTASQFDNMEGSNGSGTLHYEPHFEGSNLTAEDVAADLNFTFRRIRRGGKYAGVGNQ